MWNVVQRLIGTEQNKTFLRLIGKPFYQIIKDWFNKQLNLCITLKLNNYDIVPIKPCVKDFGQAEIFNLYSQPHMVHIRFLLLATLKFSVITHWWAVKHHLFFLTCTSFVSNFLQTQRKKTHLDRTIVIGMCIKKL